MLFNIEDKPGKGNCLIVRKVERADATNLARRLSFNSVIEPVTPKQLRYGRHGNSEYQEIGTDA